ncbi:MAG: GxxExxY protein, partial [Thermoplasmatota archaeon]
MSAPTMRSTSATPETDRISGLVVDACLKVHRNVGPGLLESVYQECLAIELKQRGLAYEREAPLSVAYEGELIPRAYFADFIVAGRVLVELKAVSVLDRNAVA